MPESPVVALPCQSLKFQPSNCYHSSAVNLQCGLDHARADGVGSEEQADVFSQQLCLGKKLERPISVRSHPQCSIAHQGLILLCLRKLSVLLGFTHGVAALQVHCVNAFGDLSNILQKASCAPAPA